MLRTLPRLVVVAALLAFGVWKSPFVATPLHAAPSVYTSVYDTVAPAGHGSVLGMFVDGAKLRLVPVSLVGPYQPFASALFATSNSLSFVPGPPYPLTLRLDVSSPVGFNAAVTCLYGCPLPGPDPNTYVFFIGFRGAVYVWSTHDNTGQPSLGIGQAGAVVGMAVRADGKFYGAEPTQIALRDPATSAAEQTFGNGATAVALGPDGDIFALDAVNNQIQRFSPDGTLDYAFTLTTPVDPNALLVGPDGQLYVADGAGGGAVYDSNNGTLLATLVSAAGTPDGPGRTSLALDNAGYLYMYDAATGIHVFSIPGRAITVPIRIRHSVKPAHISAKKKGLIPVAILSTPTFNPVTDLDLTTLTFGRTGLEQSFATCDSGKKVGKKPGITCFFSNQLTGFRVGDREAILRGKTKVAKGALAIMGSVPIRVDK